MASIKFGLWDGSQASDSSLDPYGDLLNDLERTEPLLLGSDSKDEDQKKPLIVKTPSVKVLDPMYNIASEDYIKQILTGGVKNETFFKQPEPEVHTKPWYETLPIDWRILAGAVATLVVLRLIRD